MEVTSQLNRRKACDLCFVKKIKCDMLKPVCSNCQLYKAECRTTAVRRRVGPVKPRPGPVAATADADATENLPGPNAPDGVEGTRIDGVESRLGRIEQQLEQVLAVATAAITSNAQAALPAGSVRTPASSSPGDGSAASGQTPASDSSRGHRQLASPASSSLRAPLSHRSGYELVTGDASSHPMLPPLDEILPVIEDYFLHVNSLLPLFAQSTFMRMLHEYYYNTSRHPRAAWAAINIVLALGTRLPTVPTNNVDLAAEDTKLAKYISNAQSVLSELVTRDEDLLGLQVLLGLVFIFDGLKDPRPATVLIGTAVRLAHRMKLHDRTRQDQYPNEETLQRKRLFWIAYMLDKDISMRHHTPSVQNDGDIDLALPEEKPADGAGLVYTKDGKVAANFFLLRVQLSHIQGRVYDLLHSTRSSKITPTERQMRINRLSRQLESWRLTLPRELQADNVLDNVDRSTLFWLATMHFTHLSCLVMTNGIWSHDVKWRKRISSYSLEAIIETGAPSCSHQPAPLPKSWDHCVEMSRYCMELTSQMPLSDCSLWANGCAYFSGMIVLMANMYEFPRHKHVQRDEELSRFSLSIFEKMTDAANEVYLRRLHGVALELLRRSTGAVEAARSQPLMPEPVAAVSELEDSRVDGSAAIAAGEGEQVEKQLSDPSEMTFDWEDPALNEWIGLDPALANIPAHEIFSFTSDAPDLGAGPFQSWIDAAGIA